MAAAGRLGRIGLWLAVAVVFLFPYTAEAHRTCAPFAFPAATLVLLALFALRDRRAVFARLGVPRGAGTWLRVLLSLAALAVALGWLTHGYVAPAARLEFAPLDPVTRLSFAFQGFNEEVLLGFLPLAVLVRRTGRPVLAALALAAVFALLHVALYSFGALQTWLRADTVLALCAAGALRNALILTARHVGYAWALHAGWNATMLGGTWRRDGAPLPEPAVFDALLGHPAVLAGTAVAAVCALAALRRRCT